MEPIYMPDETKRVIQELHDPLLRVEFNPHTLEWEVLKLAKDEDFMPIPGALFGSESESVWLRYPIVYWSIQAAFPHWGQHVFDALRRGRAGYRETKEIMNDMDEHDGHIRNKNQEQMDDVRETTIKKIEKGPVSYFNMKAS
jgi:hypothetical protein